MPARLECSIPFGSQNTEWSDFMDVYKMVEKLRKKQSGWLVLKTIIIISLSLPCYKFDIYAFYKFDDVVKYSFGNRVCDQWNKLPAAIVSSQGINEFKSIL